MSLPNSFGVPATAANISRGLSTNTSNVSTDFANRNAPGVVTKVNDAMSNVVVVAPKGVLQIDAFAFDYKGDDSVDLSADITDHWLEDNRTAQDHIGVKPVVVTLHGFIAELSMASDVFTQFATLLAGVQNGFSQADAYLGKYTPGMTNRIQNAISQVQNVVVQAEQALARGNQVLNLLGPGPKMNKQQRAFAQLNALWSSRVLFTVFTPFRVYDNMAIMSIHAVQPRSTRSMSDFVVTMKQLNFVGGLVDYSATHSGYAALDASGQTANGGATGNPVPLTDATTVFLTT